MRQTVPLCAGTETPLDRGPSLNFKGKLPDRLNSGRGESVRTLLRASILEVPDGRGLLLPKIGQAVEDSRLSPDPVTHGCASRAASDLS
jgi:hypothetical protein